MSQNCLHAFTNKNKVCQHTIKPLIECHPVFSKITVSNLLTQIPLRLLSLLQRSIFSWFFFLFHANADAERGISD